MQTAVKELKKWLMSCQAERGQNTYDNETRDHTSRQRPVVMSRNTLDCADSSHTVHVTPRTWHRLPASSSHLGPIPRAWNLSPRFVSLFGLLPCICFLLHLCLYEAYLFMIQFLLCPHVFPRPSVSTSIPDPFV